MTHKNWRGLPQHPADDWDHWLYSLDRYKRICAVVDALGDVDLAKLMEFAEVVSAFEASEQAERDAGASL